MSKLVDWIILFILIATSGFQYFYGNIEWIIFGLIFTLFVVGVRNEEVRLDLKAFVVISLFLIWEVIQFVNFGGFSLASLGGTLSRFLLAYFVIVLLDRRFIPMYTQFITFFSAISLIFFMLMHIQPLLELFLNVAQSIFSPPFGETMEEYSHNTNIIIFNFHGHEFDPMRNSGPFWEPGAFAIFICLSLTFTLILGNSLFSVSSLIQITALFTTYSTSGYVIFFLILLSALYLKAIKMGEGIRLLMKLFILPTLIAVLLFVVTGQDFLLPKIQEDILIADETTTSRFGSALADIIKIKEHPILGYGRNVQAQFGTVFFDKEIMHRNSGITRIVVQWGLLSLIYYFMVFRSFKHLIKINTNSVIRSAMLPFVVLILSGFSQTIFQYPFFMGLIFLNLIGTQEESVSEEFATSLA